VAGPGKQNNISPLGSLKVNAGAPRQLLLAHTGLERMSLAPQLRPLSAGLTEVEEHLVSGECPLLIQLQHK